MSRMRNLMFVGLFASALVACSDPAADAPSAKVDSAKPVNRPSSSASAKTSAAPATSAAPGTSAAPTASAAPKVDAPEKPANAVDFNNENSKIEFVGSKKIGEHNGKFEKFNGWISIDGDKAESARIWVEVDLASVKTDSADLDKHLQAEDFFWVEKMPKATFESTAIKAGGDKGATHTIEGNFGLRTLTKSLTFPATVKVTADEITAKSEFSLNRKTWDIKYDGKADNVINDLVLIKLDIKAPRKK